MSTGIGCFDPGLHGAPCWLQHDDGTQQALPVERWAEQPDAADQLLLSPCTGPTLDVGCGPGRLTAELVTRGVPVLGVDASPLAVQLTQNRGATAMHRDVFDWLPGEGRWHAVLLADGNVGIGGDPERLLRRARRLLCPWGAVVVELDPPGIGMRCGHAQLVRPDGAGPWFPWARVGADVAESLATETGFTVDALTSEHGRWFAALRTC